MGNKKGAFISLEGCEGSGKSTQISLLKDYLNENGTEFVFTREPGGTAISEDIRRIILNGAYTEMTDETEALLYAAARAQLIREKILPARKEGKIVLCDRYIDSSFAYQAFARGLGLDFVKSVNGVAMRDCIPDLTLFFDISPDEAFARKGGADKGDRLEQSGIDFHRRVYEGYLRLAVLYPERIVKIDARKTPAEVFRSVVNTLKDKKIIV